MRTQNDVNKAKNDLNHIIRLLQEVKNTPVLEYADYSLIPGIEKLVSIFSYEAAEKEGLDKQTDRLSA